MNSTVQVQVYEHVHVHDLFRRKIRGATKKVLLLVVAGGSHSLAAHVASATSPRMYTTTATNYTLFVLCSGNSCLPPARVLPPGTTTELSVSAVVMVNLLEKFNSALLELYTDKGLGEATRDSARAVERFHLPRHTLLYHSVPI